MRNAWKLALLGIAAAALAGCSTGALQVLSLIHI